MSDGRLRHAVREVIERSRGRYGSPRIQAALRREQLRDGQARGERAAQREQSLACGDGSQRCTEMPLNGIHGARRCARDGAVRRFLLRRASVGARVRLRERYCSTSLLSLF
ncbi:MAG: transposase [Myxococcales bacterium]|nr:transposase [Myxococcales bacterium]